MSETSAQEINNKPKKKQHNSVLYAAGMLTIMMTISRILGFVRDISVSSMFLLFSTAGLYITVCKKQCLPITALIYCGLAYLGFLVVILWSIL